MSDLKKDRLRKEQIRGTIKQMMKVRGLRSISVTNYHKWKKHDSNEWLHSLKIDIKDGYLHMYGFRNIKDDKRAGKRLENLSFEQYNDAYIQVMNILDDEKKIPLNIKRNILVKLSR